MTEIKDQAIIVQNLLGSYKKNHIEEEIQDVLSDPRVL